MSLVPSKVCFCVQGEDDGMDDLDVFAIADDAVLGECLVLNRDWLQYLSVSLLFATENHTSILE